MTLTFDLAGEKVESDEQLNLKEAVQDSLTPSSSMPSIPAVLPGPAATGEERQQWEGEKQSLYQQLDNKVLHLKLVHSM